MGNDRLGRGRLNCAAMTGNVGAQGQLLVKLSTGLFLWCKGGF